MIIQGDVIDSLKLIPDGSAQCVVTSPPYWGMRDYGICGQIGLEGSLDAYIRKLVGVFSQVNRVLKDGGVLWLNLGDSYTSGNRKSRGADKKNPARQMSVRPPTPEGLKVKDLLGLPWRLAFALQENGWFLRSEIIWHKLNAMPESVRDRPTRAHEQLFMLSKSKQYFYDQNTTREQNGRNRRSVWGVATQPCRHAHFATFPEDLVSPCILSTSQPGDLVLDPFFGTGTTGLVAAKADRRFLGIELNQDYTNIAAERIKKCSAAEPAHLKLNTVST
ncbi:site-specific DNA-methyltransferase [Pseudophaeobacter sp.]|uniref:DNA-methyltransferase n=1 Tax=Pseudophaeobacter sp. TaxID=1971739 RepID=UPI0032985BC2